MPPIKVTDKATEDRIRELWEQYAADLHGVQSGVSLLLAKKHDIDANAEPGRYLKHLRVGVDGAMAELGSIAKLLIDKGVITELEYVEAIAAGARAERERYEAAVREAYGAESGVKISLR